MNLLEINPYIRHAEQSELIAPHHINSRILLDYELLYIEDGELFISYNEKNFLCKNGDILLLCPNIPHSLHVSRTNLIQPHIHFDLKYDSYSEQRFVSFNDYCNLTSAQRKMIQENPFLNLQHSPFVKISNKHLFLKLFYGIIKAREPNSLTAKSDMLRLIQMIISENASETFSLPAKNSDIAFLIKSYVDANYDQEICLDNLERYFGYSKYYIEKRFKQKYHISVMNYRNNKRIAAATQLLFNHSVTQTAQLLGFSSIYTFSRTFHKAYGLSPTKYKEKTAAQPLNYNPDDYK